MNCRCDTPRATAIPCDFCNTSASWQGDDRDGYPTFTCDAHADDIPEGNRTRIPGVVKIRIAGADSVIEAALRSVGYVTRKHIGEGGESLVARVSRKRGMGAQRIRELRTLIAKCAAETRAAAEALAEAQAQERARLREAEDARARSAAEAAARDARARRAAARKASAAAAEARRSEYTLDDALRDEHRHGRDCKPENEAVDGWQALDRHGEARDWNGLDTSEWRRRG